MNHDDSITVIIPTFNDEGTVAQAIQSTLDQACERVEIIIVDDGSTDRTADTAHQFGRKVRLHQRATNGGHAAARNDGIRIANNNWITFLDADDIWLPNGLQPLQHATAQYPTARVLQAQYRNRWPINHRDNDEFGTRLPSVLFHRSVFEQVGLLDEAANLAYGEDFDFWVRIRHHNITVQRIEHVATMYHRQPDQRPNRWEAHHQTRLRILKRHLDQFRPKST